MVSADNQKLCLYQKTKINYPVYFLNNIFVQGKITDRLSRLCKNKKLLVVIDKKVSKIYGRTIRNSFNTFDNNATFFDIEATEKNKNFRSVIKLSHLAKDIGLRRDSVFIAIGGGITLDIVGIAAFLYRRKINYIRIPTTIVGMVDAGVGLKVGVNFGNAKNFLGGYYAPLAVFSDQSFLNTIGEKETRSGLYEILKMAIVKSPTLFKMLDNDYRSFINKKLNKRTLKIMRLSSYLMMVELEDNLYERELKRKVDFGHTFSPFLEVNSKFMIPHGQAVGIDILISSLIALNRKLITKSEFNKIYNLIKKIGFSKKYKLPSAEKLFVSLNDIKKHRSGNLNLVLPNLIGSCVFTNKCLVSELQTAINFLIAEEIFT